VLLIPVTSCLTGVVDTNQEETKNDPSFSIINNGNSSFTCIHDTGNAFSAVVVDTSDALMHH
jgi:hypothetical protein